MAGMQQGRTVVNGGAVSRQAADDVAQVIRGKLGLRRLVELAEATSRTDPRAGGLDRLRLRPQ